MVHTDQLSLSYGRYSSGHTRQQSWKHLLRHWARTSRGSQCLQSVSPQEPLSRPPDSQRGGGQTHMPHQRKASSSGFRKAPNPTRKAAITEQAAIRGGAGSPRTCNKGPWEACNREIPEHLGAKCCYCLKEEGIPDSETSPILT